MEEKLELTLYIIQKWMLERDVDDQSGQASVKFIVVLERRIMSELLGTYLPTFLLVGITFSTTFFKAEYFEAALTVGVFHIKNEPCKQIWILHPGYQFYFQCFMQM